MTRRRSIQVLGAVAGVLALAGCARNAPQDTWQPAGENSRRIDNLQRPVFYVAGVVLVIVVAAVLFALRRFRDRGQEMPEQVHGKPWLEILLTIIPAMILLVVGVATVTTVFALAKTDDTACIVNVTGQQWWWEYDYPAQPGCMAGGITTPIVTSGQLVLPTGVKVLAHVTSRDVIHSFWIPKLNGKRDAVPGRDQTLRLEVDQPGIYTGQCTEFCGLSHARMRMEGVGLYPQDFSTWVTKQLADYQSPAKDTLAKTGEGTFTAQCSRCHQVNGLTNTVDGKQVPVLANPDQYEVSGAAPNLTHLMSRNSFAGATWDLLNDSCRDKVWKAAPADFGALYLQGVSKDCLDESRLREWLRNAPGLKPMYSAESQKAADGKYRGMPNLNLSEVQIDSLIAYLLTRT